MTCSRRRTAALAAPLLILLAAAAVPAPPAKLAQEYGPDPASVERHGPAYRYPKSGWIVLHVEGAPYDRGEQHGRLLAREIADYIKTLSVKRSMKDPNAAWRQVRTAVDALFLRRYDPEYLEEMKGIADGAAAAGAEVDGRPVDLLDVVAINSEIELDFLESALAATPNGLEGKAFKSAGADAPAAEAPEHCSAFIANGKATADGSIVFGHITMFGLNMVRHFNVWLDIKPEDGHRVLMQTYPGGIQSGMDYYMNDAGLVVAETTIRQTGFEVGGKALASRIRRALQYADSIDGVVAALTEGNNGLYSNEWLIADTKTNETAMFELGTKKSRLWRSSKDEWFGGTEGFYWGCNNPKDLDVRLETVASVEGRPANLVFRPSDRDRKWLELYHAHKGKIGVDFGFLAFTTPPLAASHSCDAKFTTSAMARELKTWAVFGPPIGGTWEVEPSQRSLPGIRELVPNDWAVLTAEPPSAGEPGAKAAVDLATSDARVPAAVDEPAGELPPAWHGTILPATDADTWLAAAFADYERIVALELALKKARQPGAAIKDRVALALFAARSRYRAAVARLGRDEPLTATRKALLSADWYDLAAGKGVLFLAALRERRGDAAFLKLMDDFGRAHAGKPASTADFRAAAESAPGAPLGDLFARWLESTGLPGEPDRPAWSVDSFFAEPERALIVYGTRKEKAAQAEAAELLRRRIARAWSNIPVPVKPDNEVTDDDLENHHLLLVGRPDSNAVYERLDHRLPVAFGPGSFRVGEATYAHPGSAVIAAAANPRNARYGLVAYSGLGAEATREAAKSASDSAGPAEVVVRPSTGRTRRLLSAGTTARELAARP